MRRAAAWGVILVSAIVIALAVVLTEPSEAFFVVTVVGSYAAVGGVVTLRRPEHHMGWWLLLVAALWAVPVFPLLLGEYLADQGEDGPLVGWLLWWPFWTPALGVMGTQVLLRFPDGRLPSSRWRPFSRISAAVIVLATIALGSSEPTLYGGVSNPTYGAGWEVASAVLLLSFPIMFVVSAASLFLRYRRADSVQRTQIRWIAWAGAVFVASWIVSLASGVFGKAAVSQALEPVAFVGYALVPASIGFAVLKYRLFEIDRIISRTTSYLLVTGVVVLIYVTVVTTVSRLVPGSSSLAVAAATLAAAAFFRPALTRIQSTVDRRFNRYRYDAQQLVDDFTRRLRDEIDPDLVLEDCLRVVERTVAPEHVGLWVRRPE